MTTTARDLTALAPGRATRGPARVAAREQDGHVESGAEPLWTIEGASQYLNLSISAVYKMTARKATVRIPHIRIGGKLRFKRADLDAWLALLTVSNLDVLGRMRSKVARSVDGNNTQATSP